MKKSALRFGVCLVGLSLALAGCGDGDGGDESSDLDPETEEIMEIAENVTANLGLFASPTSIMGRRRLAGLATSQNFDRAFFNEPVPGFTGGSAVRNGNLHMTVSGSASEYEATVSISGNYLTMITFDDATTRNGAVVNGRLSDGGTISGSVHVGLSDSGSGRVEFTDTLQSQPDFTVNGKSHSILITTTYIITVANGAATASGRQSGIVDSRPVSRTF